MHAKTRIRLRVPFERKDEFKACGCRWDSVERTWWAYPGTLSMHPWIEAFADIAAPLRDEHDHAAPAPAGTHRVTEQWLRDHASHGNGFTSAQLAALGIRWPPPKRWIEVHVGTLITESTRRLFEAKGAERRARKAHRAVVLSKPGRMGKEPAPGGLPLTCSTCTAAPWDACPCTLAHNPATPSQGAVGSDARPSGSIPLGLFDS